MTTACCVVPVFLHSWQRQLHFCDRTSPAGHPVGRTLTSVLTIPGPASPALLSPCRRTSSTRRASCGLRAGAESRRRTGQVGVQALALPATARAPHTLRAAEASPPPPAAHLPRAGRIVCPPCACASWSHASRPCSMRPPPARPPPGGRGTLNPAAACASCAAGDEEDAEIQRQIDREAARRQHAGSDDEGDRMPGARQRARRSRRPSDVMLACLQASLRASRPACCCVPVCSSSQPSPTPATLPPAPPQQTSSQGRQARRARRARARRHPAPAAAAARRARPPAWRLAWT